MIAHYKIDFDDIIALQKDAIKIFKFHHKNKIFLSVLAFCIGFIFSLFTTEGNAVRSFFLALIVFLCSPVLYNIIALQKYKSDLKSSNSDMTGDYKLTISAEEICIEKGNISKKHKWEEIVKASSDEYRYFLYTNRRKAIMLKKPFPDLNKKETDELNFFIKKQIHDLGLDKKGRV